MLKGTIIATPRQCAIAAMSDVLDRGMLLTDSPALHGSLSGRDLAMARHLAYSVLRWLTALDWLADQMLNKPVKQRDRDIRRLLLLGLYQLWKDGSAPHAAINEAAECARHLGKPWAVGIVNAVLRRFQREREMWLSRLSECDEQHAHPQWMLERFRSDWPKDWQNIVQENNQQARMWLRVNRLGPGKPEVTKRLASQGYAVEEHPSAIDAICIEPAAPVSDLAGFDAGHYSVQDPAAQLAADLLDAQPGMHVLDACAAPGGKTCHLLERTPGAIVTAIDHHEVRMDLVRENLQRLNLHATLITGDATEPRAWWDGVRFQRILVDAPCTATGVIRRHPEIKHLRQPGHLQEAARLQQRLLRQLWPLLDAGGILVYATCSVFHDENSHQIKEFLAQSAGAEEQVAGVAWGQAQAFGRQILPGEQDMDGFYYAILRKMG